MNRRHFVSLSAAAATLGLAGSLALSAIASPEADPADDPALAAQAATRWASRGFATRMVKANGVKLHVAEAGRGDPIVLLHGYPQSGEAWRLVAPLLAKRHKVIVPDLRGMGLSEAAVGGYDLVNVAEDIHQLIAGISESPIKLVGHDWGAAVAAVYALRYRNSVTKLAFLESALAGAGFETLWNFSKPNAGFTFIPFLLMGEGEREDDITSDLIKGREALFLHHLWSSFTGDKLAAPFSSWAPYVAAMHRPGVARSAASYYRTAYVSADEVRRLIATKLNIPVLAIAGEKGIGANHLGFVTPFAAEIAGNLIIPGGGHFIAEERPAQVAAALLAFLG